MYWISPCAHLKANHFRNLLPVEKRAHQIKLMLICNKFAYLFNYFNLVGNLHNYATRGSAMDLISFRCNSSTDKNTLNIQLQLNKLLVYLHFHLWHLANALMQSEVRRGWSILGFVGKQGFKSRGTSEGNTEVSDMS